MHVIANDEYSFTWIDHKFMVSGHSYLPNDRDFGSIENARKKVSTSTSLPTGKKSLHKLERRMHFLCIEWTGKNSYH